MEKYVQLRPAQAHTFPKFWLSKSNYLDLFYWVCWLIIFNQMKQSTQDVEEKPTP
jgi:hypothetical protein